jgi:hypothetical protein
MLGRPLHGQQDFRRLGRPGSDGNFEIGVRGAQPPQLFT